MACILLIDDDLMVRRAIQIILQKSSHQVIEAGDGHQGLALFRKHPVDLVITDLIMPDVEGIETIRLLKEISPRIPIIAISGGGRGSPEYYLKFAQKLGAAKTFAKPFDIGALSAAITHLLGDKDAKPPLAPAS